MGQFFKASRREKHKSEPWKILVVDDEPDVHAITSVVARDVKFHDRDVKVLSAYSSSEAIEILKEVPDIALAIIDVVMESEHAGLDLVKHIREDLGNKRIRIVIRTGQPGYAPPREIILRYDINDYREKSELSGNALFTLIVSKLREYLDYTTLDKQRLLLSKLGFLSILGVDLDSVESLPAFLDEAFIGMSHVLETNVSVSSSTSSLDERMKPRKPVWRIEGGATSLNFSVRNGYASSVDFSVRFDSEIEETFKKIINVFLTQVIAEIENSVLTKDLVDTLYKIVYIISEVTETRSLETGEHVKRVSEVTGLLAEALGFSGTELEYLKIAAMLHDVGKIGIPDSILMKPSKLSDEEFEIIKQHTVIGHRILSTVDHHLFKIASQVALYHHENWDGSGYPKGLKGEDIPLHARIVSLVDVYDALRANRVYRKAFSEEEALEFVNGAVGKKFDPKVHAAFTAHYDAIRRLYLP